MAREFCSDCGVASHRPGRSYCLNCAAARSRRWWATHDHPDDAARSRRWREGNREAWLGSLRRYKEANREKFAAYRALKRAVARGDLVREPCEVCGVEPAESHHPDYSRPLDVRWYCRSHHRSLHREERDALWVDSIGGCAVK